jgi:hypothetical protein
MRTPAESAYERPFSLPNHENPRETETQNAANEENCTASLAPSGMASEL